jgi:hypothetical protein
VRDANGNVVHDANGNIVYRHHYYWHPWPGYRGYYGHSNAFWTSTPFSNSSSGRTTSATSGSTAGATSRGGFGSTGHATAGS